MNYLRNRYYNLFKKWLGLSGIKFNEYVELYFNDWDCYHYVCCIYCNSVDNWLSRGLNDMELIITYKTFEELLNEYELHLDTKDCLLVLN